MNSEDRLRELASIDWRKVGSAKQEADCVDAKEFLQRAACFLVKNGIAGQHPFFDPSEVLNASLPRELVSRINATVTNEAFPLAKRVSVFHVLTCGVDDADAHDIYSPLISIFRRGGSIDYHSGELIVDDEWAISMRGWIERFSSVVS